MAKYMLIGNYTAEGSRGLLKDGGTRRREVVERLLEGIGGRLEAFYFMFGDDDVLTIVDVPDNVTMAAASLALAASGAITARTVVLLTAEEIDEAVRARVGYTPPGASSVS